MFKRLIILAAGAVLASAASCGSAGAGCPKGYKETVTISTAERDICVGVEMAETPEERRTGLMYRKSLPDFGGMLFDFSDEDRIQSMWMKNTLIPLDMAFIAKDGRIVRIEAMTTPRSLASISSGEPVAAVLEVGGGRLGAIGVKTGDVVKHEIFKND